MYKTILKPIFDILFAIIVLILFFPVLVIVFVFLTISNNGSAFFFQDRPGKNGKVFKIIKFKTMNDQKDIDGNLLPDAVRLTKTGSFVRKISLDELPQLLNILKGDMSLIGPRPLRVSYLEMYSTDQLRRHDVKPGITGWAQINGRNAITWSKKFQLDLYYVDNLSFRLDVKIFFRTILKVFKSQDINTAGHATTERFNGKN